MSSHSGSATLPKGFRYLAPETPEPPCQSEEARIPSAPRPRLRLKRRNVSHQLSGPTQQFLASVAAADVPIPSIEEPETSSPDMIGIDHATNRHAGSQDSFLRPGEKSSSLPRTPVPEVEPVWTSSRFPSRYPDWTLDSSVSSSVESTPDPDCESSRPSTARSTQTSASFLSGLSQLSDLDRCASPDGNEVEGFALLYDLDSRGTRGTSGSKAKARKAPWTRAMSDHLWSTFKLYLQDPKVTPLRMGNSCIPPHGVLLRVAREAKRSWKGSKSGKMAAKPSDGRKSGSITPTGQGPAAFMEWPHTCAATRAHLRELCKLEASGSNDMRSQGAAPFTQAAYRRWNRRSTPLRPPSSFGIQDMSISLAVSTADSMQPGGPLAQLTTRPTAASQDWAGPARGDPVTPQRDAVSDPFEGDPSFVERRRLGSPLSPKSHGPASSTTLAASFGMGSPVLRRQTHSMAAPRRTLQSPVRMSRSAAVTQQRRNTQCGAVRKRPSIAGDIWLDPASSGSVDVLQPDSATSTDMPNVAAPSYSATSQVAAPLEPIARLGSPFSGARASLSFPNRLHRQQPGSVDLGMLGRPFATVQHAADAMSALRNTSLAGRLAYIDARLKELRQREPLRRSDSPC